jgi:tRNA (adenine22-N1)-methyltransferase
MSAIKLSKRLSAIAELIPPAGSVVDVGTDHGYIPVFLLQRGFTGAVTATDINPGPLARAEQNAAVHGFADRICFLLCDGLELVSPERADTVVIAGMGGETIAAILEAAPWTREKLLILQPMTKSERLRGWLFHKGYRVLSEALVDDGGLYEILTATGGHDCPYAPGELLTGHLALARLSPLFPARLAALIAKLNRAASGLENRTDAESAARRADIERDRQALCAMKIGLHN